LHRLGENEIKDLKEIFSTFNKKNSILEQKTFLKEERLFEAFSAFDKAHNGKITKDKLKRNI